jgi:hypothetical protein
MTGKDLGISNGKRRGWSFITERAAIFVEAKKDISKMS